MKGQRPPEKVTSLRDGVVVEMRDWLYAEEIIKLISIMCNGNQVCHFGKKELKVRKRCKQK